MVGYNELWIASFRPTLKTAKYVVRPVCDCRNPAWAPPMRRGWRVDFFRAGDEKRNLRATGQMDRNGSREMEEGRANACNGNGRNGDAGSWDGRCGMKREGEPRDGMTSQFWGEFLGTLVLICGRRWPVVAGVR